MLNRLIHRFLAHRHFWRDADFTEIAEMYASSMLRSMAIGMVSVFVGVYLLRNGYSPAFVLFYFALYFFLRILSTYPAAHLIARFGPKHTTMLSNFSYIPAMLALTMLSQWGWVSLAIVCGLQAFSVTLYCISYDVNLSKVKHVDHAGKEIGFVYFTSKVGTALSPLIGGAIATFVGAEFTLIAAALVFMVAAAPSLLTPEPVGTRQHLSLKNTPWRRIWPHLRSYASVGVDIGASGSVWSIFIAVVIFAGAGNEIYAKIGALSSITLVAALVAARLYGVLIDRQRGRELMWTGVIANSFVHALRPFFTTVPGVLLLNVVNELTTTAYNLPYAKGAYDEADSLTGQRIVFLSLMSVAVSTGACAYLLIASGLVLALGAPDGLKGAYLLAAVATLPIGLNGFRVFLQKQA